MNLKAFLKGNAIEAKKEVECVVSDRFKDEAGKPVPFLLRLLEPTEITAIQNSGIVKDKKGNIDYKSDVMQLNLVVASIKEPDLLNKELQDSYNVTTPHDLINKMLTGPEYVGLSARCMSLQGLNQTLDDKVDEVKN